MRNDLLEPERSSSLVFWAVRQLFLYLVGGFAAYWLITNYGLFRPSAPAEKPQAQSAPAEAAPAAPLTVLGRAAPVALNSLSLRARLDGYVYVKASVNDMPMTMAFDTGAAMVSLTQTDALKAGVAGNLNYTLSFSTANGQTRGAPVLLRSVRIDGLEIDNVQAVVMQNLNVSLLGQSFLNRLESYQMHDSVLTLSWH
jgi:aspartyl protease family protein